MEAGHFSLLDLADFILIISFIFNLHLFSKSMARQRFDA